MLPVWTLKDFSHTTGYSRFKAATGYIADLPNTAFVVRDYSNVGQRRRFLLPHTAAKPGYAQRPVDHPQPLRGRPLPGENGAGRLTVAPSLSQIVPTRRGATPSFESRLSAG